MAHPHRQIDVFVGPGARGNPAGVVVLHAPLAEAEMQAQARQLGLPATAFVASEPHGGAHDIRWFAPQREIALCGHGALAAGSVLLSQGARSVILRSGEGRLLEVRRADGDGGFALALSGIPTKPRAQPEIPAMLGAQPLETLWNERGYALAIFASAADVRSLAPDLEAAHALGTVQVIATARSKEEGYDIVSRVFSGGKEDAATGSAHAVLATYWCERLGCDSLTAYQASARGGRLSCRLDGERVWIGGALREAGS
ncbi:PhzF family phenazine biosynthesis protein [Altererythrobacter arenosus]|uniref:PhzF family phenazine biosynthesis protein n=1 Tax=Altererythrobacter arenosus TaxID=3032592 RepID=A0ABY8FUQ6_9SPHN|nr:PhzF family phenazine biosynthesis protein [Altererythrobacter sp. CAU 1644]WFL78735.1 PhzF family phenazine biosynthesis protein [Altererythrobacter sp. CAU 1644]